VNRSAADLARDKTIFDVAYPDVTRISMSYEDALLSKKFTRLHCSVLGFVKVDLEQVLRESTLSEINALDCNDRSPLYWAVRRADTVGSELLLRYGADPNVGVSPIVWSCRGSFAAPECLRAF